MNNNENGLIWDSESLVVFGMWLVRKGEYGYGLLIIHGSCLGIKIGSLLKLTWDDFILLDNPNDPIDNDNCTSKNELRIHSKKNSAVQIIELSRFIQRYTLSVFLDLNNDKQKDIYINSKTGKNLTTSSLNKELNKLYEQFKSEVYSLTNLELKFRDLKTNTFEIAWGRDMILKYNCTKKVFIEVSKYMGHRTVNDTIELLELKPNDTIKFSHNLFDPQWRKQNDLENLFNNKNVLLSYLTTNNLAFDNSSDDINKGFVYKKKR
jgi:hypothetical protein